MPVFVLMVIHLGFSKWYLVPVVPHKHRAMIMRKAVKSFKQILIRTQSFIDSALTLGA
jgi:hypothetical protein